MLEGGRNTKTLLKDFVQAQAEIKLLKASAQETKLKLMRMLDKKKKQLLQTQDQLYKM